MCTGSERCKILELDGVHKIRTKNLILFGHTLIVRAVQHGYLLINSLSNKFSKFPPLPESTLESTLLDMCGCMLQRNRHNRQICQTLNSCSIQIYIRYNYGLWVGKSRINIKYLIVASYPEGVPLSALVDGSEDALVDPKGHGGGEQRQRQVPAHRQEWHVLRRNRTIERELYPGTNATCQTCEIWDR